MNRLRRTLSIILLVVLVPALSMRAVAAQPSNGVFAESVRAYAVSLPAEVLFQRSADAVFMLETFDRNGTSIRTGSGFFISDTGLAVTCLHVIERATSATITLNNGDVYPVSGVHAASEEFNLVIFSIDSDDVGWTYLDIADADVVEAGNAIYVIGSPLGHINTMTAGIISTAKRVLDDETFIQFTAPISFGSGGSPLLNTRGQVVGVASSSFSYGQHLNLAVPINPLKTMTPGNSVPLDRFN